MSHCADCATNGTDKISSGPNKLAAMTVRKYMQDIDRFINSIERHELPSVLASVTVDALNSWERDQEEHGNGLYTIANRVITAKTFTNKFIYNTLDLTTEDLLRKVRRPSAPAPQRQVLTPIEIEELIGCSESP